MPIVHIATYILYSRIKFHAPNFDNFQVITGSRIHQTPERTDRRTDRERKQNDVHIVYIATYSRMKFHATSFNSYKVIKGSRSLADRRTDGRTEGKPVVPSGVNTGKGLIISRKQGITYSRHSVDEVRFEV